MSAFCTWNSKTLAILKFLREENKYYVIIFTFSLEMESGKMRYWALGNSGSKVPVFELSEYFLVNPPWKWNWKIQNSHLNVKYKSPENQKKQNKTQKKSKQNKQTKKQIKKNPRNKTQNFKKLYPLDAMEHINKTTCINILG